MQMYVTSKQGSDSVVLPSQVGLALLHLTKVHCVGRFVIKGNWTALTSTVDGCMIILFRLMVVFFPHLGRLPIANNCGAGT